MLGKLTPGESEGKPAKKFLAVQNVYQGQRKMWKEGENKKKRKKEKEDAPQNTHQRKT